MICSEKVAVGLAAFSLMLSTHLLHLCSIDTASADLDESAPPLLLPSGMLTKTIALGQATTLADIYWLKLVQYAGTKSEIRANLPQLLELANLVTDLDPEFGYAYEAPAIMLASLERFDQSDSLLHKGMSHIPGRWQFPFYAAFNEWYGRGDLNGGAELLLRAARIPHGPSYLAPLAAKLYSSANEIDTGLALIDSMLSQDLPLSIADDMRTRQLELLVERDLRTLEAAVSDYGRKFDERPLSLALLPGVNGMPTAPDGSFYVYDAVDGTVSSPLLTTRLRYHDPDSVAEPVAIPR